MTITAEDIQLNDEIIKRAGQISDGDMLALHTALCDEGQIDREAAENYLNHYVRQAMRLMIESDNYKERMSIMGTALRHMLIVGILCGKDHERRVD